MLEGRPGASLPPLDLDSLKASLVDKHGEIIKDTDVMSAALYPKVFDEYAQFVDKYGPVDKLDTKTFLAGPDVEEEIHVSKQTVELDCSLVKLFAAVLSLVLRLTQLDVVAVYVYVIFPSTGGA